MRTIVCYKLLLSDVCKLHRIFYEDEKTFILLNKRVLSALSYTFYASFKLIIVHSIYLSLNFISFFSISQLNLSG